MRWFCVPVRSSVKFLSTLGGFDLTAAFFDTSAQKSLSQMLSRPAVVDRLQRSTQRLLVCAGSAWVCALREPGPEAPWMNLAGRAPVGGESCVHVAGSSEISCSARHVAVLGEPLAAFVEMISLMLVEPSRQAAVAVAVRSRQGCVVAVALVRIPKPQLCGGHTRGRRCTVLAGALAGGRTHC